MKRVVIDTNLFISYLLAKGPTLSRLIEHWKAGSFLLITSPPILQELFDVMQRPRLRRHMKGDPQVLYELVVKDAIATEGRLTLHVGRDPKDSMFLACAVEGEANVIVTGDDDLLTIGEYEGITIMRATDFVAWLDTGDDSLPLRAKNEDGRD